MEPPRGFLASLWNFICFLPYFVGLLILGTIKGALMCPLICLVMTIGNSAVILGLWPMHLFYSYSSILRTKKLGPLLKLVISLCIPIVLISWPPLGIISSILGGAAYGFLAPMFATFQAVGQGKSNEFWHCISDGTWDTLKGSFNVVRDLADVCYHSFFSVMNDLLLQGPSEGKYYEIRLRYLPGALIVGILGFIIDMPVISLIALFKSPYMLFKGWKRLFHDCIGREGPFLDTICVPFAGLAIILWPLAVVGAVLGSMVSSIFLGAYAAVVVYQESSFWLGLRYIIASLSLYDEYSNDTLDLPEGSCIPRPQYRRDTETGPGSQGTSLSRPDSFRNPPSRTTSLNAPMIELKPLEFADGLFKECRRNGELLVSQGVITLKDIEDAKSDQGSGRVITSGLPAYGLLQILLRSAKANSVGLLLGDNATEITSTNRPKDTFFDWFLNPLLIIKDQIKAENLSLAEEEYLGKLVLFGGDHARLKNSNLGFPPESELRRAELDALARRLQGIMKSILRYPTFRRRFDSTLKGIFEDLMKKSGDSRKGSIPRSRSMFPRIFSQKSFKGRGNNSGYDQEDLPAEEREVEVV